MAGGILEGVVRLYTEKNWWVKHLFFIAFSFVVSFNELIKVKKDDANLDVVVLLLVILILNIVVAVVSWLFTVHFIHNCIKYFRKLDTVEDKNALKKLPLMPDYNGRLFKHFGDLICFIISWILIFLVFLFVVLLVCLIPLLGLIVVPCAVLFITVTNPYVIARFAEDYKTYGNLNPSLLFSIFPKVWKPAVLLCVKCWLIYICIFVLLIFPFLLISAVTGSADFIMSVIFSYIGIVLGYAYYYSVTYIYCHNDV